MVGLYFKESRHTYSPIINQHKLITLFSVRDLFALIDSLLSGHQNTTSGFEILSVFAKRNDNTGYMMKHRPSIGFVAFINEENISRKFSSVLTSKEKPTRC